MLDGDAVVFRTAAGTKLDRATRGPVVFEVDHIDRATRSGWSVIVHGLAQEVTSFDRVEFRERVAALPVDPWAQGEKPHLVRIAPGSITGRRVGERELTPRRLTQQVGRRRGRSRSGRATDDRYDALHGGERELSAMTEAPSADPDPESSQGATGPILRGVADLRLDELLRGLQGQLQNVVNARATGWAGCSRPWSRSGPT